MARPKSGKSAPKGGMSIIDRFSLATTGEMYTPPATPTGATVSTSTQMQNVTPVAPAKIEESSTEPKAVAKPKPAPAKKAPARRPPARPAASARPVPQPNKPKTYGWREALNKKLDEAKRKGNI